MNRKMSKSHNFIIRGALSKDIATKILAVCNFDVELCFDGFPLCYYRTSLTIANITPPCHSLQENEKVAPQVHPTQHCNS